MSAMTKKQRIEQKVAEGMSHLDAEIAAQKEEGEEKLRRLLAKQKREEAKVREKQPEWLRINHPDLWQQSVEEISAELDAHRRRYRDDPVVAFWAEMESEFVWDLLPTTFLYQLFTAWLGRRRPANPLLSRNAFLKGLQEHLTSSADWDFPDRNKTIRVGPRMDAPEPLISEYELTDWYSPDHASDDSVEQKCRPKTRATHRGVRRKKPLGLDHRGQPRDSNDEGETR